MEHFPQHEPNAMTVNVRLCGSIPRKDLSSCSLADWSHDVTPDRCKTHATHRRSEEKAPLILASLTEPSPLAPIMEPPAWAVPAKGETRLEPVCEALGRQTAVDLTLQPCFRVGRSPNCDVQLMHATSSRRHAMIFHHPNGTCYIVDCESAHGTYVNGVRINTTTQGGMVLPHKVKRGALIRFGGPGAPCFVLKSFSFELNDVCRDTPDMGELVRRNTRINALGKTANESIRGRMLGVLDQALRVVRKRSFDSLASEVTLDEEEPPEKRMRCSSPPLSPEAPLRLVSPDFSPPCTRRVHFSTEPPQTFYPALVTPDELSSEEDNE